MKTGIDKISFAIPARYFDLSALAAQRGIDPAKFSRGIGQDRFAMPEHDEDIVTLGAEAALPLLDASTKNQIDTLLFATESGLDQSKAAGIHVHHLLGLPARCRVVEMKQACYSATAALQLACAHVARRPERKVLVIAADVARYDLDGPAEATQGCGGVAMVVGADPAILALDPFSGCHTEDIYDFWRPPYRETPLVDGKFSALKYLQTLAHAWEAYQADGGRPHESFARICYHLPFSRMGEKAHRHLAGLAGVSAEAERLDPGLTYARDVGNCYSASLYLSLISTLDNSEEDLGGKAIGLFSYGSGAVGEMLSGEVQPGYRTHLLTERHRTMLAERKALSHSAYLDLWHGPRGAQGGEIILPQAARGTFRLARIHDHKREYTSRTPA